MRSTWNAVTMVAVAMAAVLMLSITPTSADTTSFHPTKQSALAACQSEYAYLHTDACLTAPRDYLRWCDTSCIGNFGGGLTFCGGKEQLWTATNLGYSCTTLTANPVHRFVFPSSPCAANTTLVGPTSSDLPPHRRVALTWIRQVTRSVMGWGEPSATAAPVP